MTKQILWDDELRRWRWDQTLDEAFTTGRHVLDDLKNMVELVLVDVWSILAGNLMDEDSIGEDEAKHRYQESVVSFVTPESYHLTM